MSTIELDPGVDLSDLQIHPLCAVLRKHFGHDADEWGVLYRSVAELGLIGICITLDAADHSVIDGWSRYCAWKEACRHDDGFAQRHPLAPHVEVRVFASDKERIEFMLFKQHGRRSLNAMQRAELVERLLESSSTVEPPLIDLMKFGFSRTTVLRLKRLERRASPAVQAAVAAGEVPARDIDALVTLPKNEQEELAALEGAAGLRARAAEVREGGRGSPGPSAGGLDRASSLSRREAEWRRERERPLPEPPPIGPRRAPEARGEPAAGDWISEMDRLEYAWASYPEAERLAFLRSKPGSIEKALSPEQRDDMVARYGGGQVNGSDQAASELLRMGDALMRAMPHNGMVLEFCSKVANKVTSKGVAQPRV